MSSEETMSRYDTIVKFKSKSTGHYVGRTVFCGMFDCKKQAEHAANISIKKEFSDWQQTSVKQTKKGGLRITTTHIPKDEVHNEIEAIIDIEELHVPAKFIVEDVFNCVREGSLFFMNSELQLENKYDGCKVRVTLEIIK